MPADLLTFEVVTRNQTPIGAPIYSKLVLATFRKLQLVAIALRNLNMQPTMSAINFDNYRYYYIITSLY